MEIKTFAQLDKLVKDYKFVCLCDSEGSQLVNFNNATTPMKKRLEQIKKRLESPALSDGIYIIKCKDAIKGQKADEIIYVKGEGTAAPVPAAPAPTAKTLKETTEPAVLTYAEAIRLNSEIKRLEYEVRTLTTERDQYKKDLEAAESELDDLNTAAVAKLSEGAPNTLSQLGNSLKEILPSVTALFDTHFQLKERELKIKENQRQQPAPVQAPINAPDIPGNAFILDDNEQNILNYFEALKTGNPEQYNKIYDSMQQEMEQADKGEQGA